MRAAFLRALTSRLAFWLLALYLVQLLGCACDAPREHRGPPAYLSGQPSPSSAHAVTSAGSAALPSEPPDPRDLHPLLEDARLTAVKAAVRQGDRRAAASALRAALAQHAPRGEERARWLYLLGRLSMECGDAAGAAVAFDEAASAKAWVLRDYAALGAADAYVALQEHEEAAARARSVRAGAPIFEHARLTLADALDAMGSRDEAVQVWREHLATHPTGEGWPHGAVRIAEALLEGPEDPDRTLDALRWLRRVLSEAPTSKVAPRAGELEHVALARLPSKVRHEVEAWPMEMRMQRARSLADRGRKKQALDTLTALMDALGPGQGSGSVGCSAAFLKAKLLGTSRKKRAAAADAYVQAVRRCGHHRQLVKALYAGAKMHARVGRLRQAMVMFARVEKEFSGHRFADDARLRGAKVALLMHDEPKFEKMLSTMAHDYPEGDMLEDGLFALAFHHIGKGAWKKAIGPLERSVGLRPREKKYWEGGRARYFLARAYENVGRHDEARAAYERVVVEHPLSYYMLLAYGRLRSRTPEAAAEAMKRGESAAPAAAAPGPLPEKLSGPGFARAIELLRLAEVDMARAEVKRLGLSSNDDEALWTMARLYARAGGLRIAHQVARARSRQWAGTYPKGRWREAWRLAYPQMYAEIVQRETDAAGIPVPLAYGIMREESAFDANVVSFAQAYGLMQLILPTARSVARTLKMKVDDQSLRRPEVNVKLGCRLLGKLRGMFPSAPVLAIPSYNAGAGATKRWLRNRASDEFDLWVEGIAYRETRGYTKRVLSTMAVYAYLYYPNDLGLALQLPERLDL